MNQKFLCLFILLTCLGMLYPEPVIQFKETTLDFGEIQSGKVMDLKFEFENTGTGVLIIKNLSTSCGCTAAQLTKSEYMPGETGEIAVKYFSKGKRGRIREKITVATNDKAHIYNRLEITGIVLLKDFAMAAITPSSVNFKRVELGKKTTQILKIKNTGNRRLVIVELSHGPEFYLDFNQKIIKPGEEIEVNLVFTPMQTGEFSGFVRMRTTGMEPFIILKVDADISG